MFTQLVENFVCHPCHCQTLRGCMLEIAVVVVIVITYLLNYLLTYLLRGAWWRSG